MADGQTGRLLRRPRAVIAPAAGESTDRQLLERFARFRDEAAFAALVERHGPMVLNVCSRVLKDRHQAEDAFQATFLVLVRKAGAVGQPELLGNWLYGVAYRIAVKARARAAKRCEHERRAAAMPKPEPACSERQALREVLDAGMNGLPAKYRAPLVLCYLQGKTNEEAAHLLGCPAGTMSYRLARGRELLRRRLTRRGMVFTGGLFPKQLTQHATSATVPGELASDTVKAAMWFAAGKASSAGVLSASVLELTEEMLGTMLAVKLRNVAAAVLLALAFFLGAGLVAHGALAGEQATPSTPGCRP
jgi:RNA polymerase sigma factor (sigma-70 family)